MGPALISQPCSMRKQLQHALRTRSHLLPKPLQPPQRPVHIISCAATQPRQPNHSSITNTSPGDRQQLPASAEVILLPQMSRRQLVAFGCSCCLSLVQAQQQPAAADSGHFSYAAAGADGPAHWPGVCSSGVQQSPINLSLSSTACDGRPPPEFRYQPSSSATVKNTGATLQVNLPAGSSTVSWAGQQLELLQYHFHTPSEHTVEGAHTALEAHLVHRNNQTGGFTVLAVLLEATPGAQQQPAANPCLAAGLAAVPSTAGATAPCSNPINPTDLLPSGAGLQQYVAYRGSLTTPPCSEGVEWLVWTQPVRVPQQQVQAFRRFAGMNARPLQALNDRALAVNCITQA